MNILLVEFLGIKPIYSLGPIYFTFSDRVKQNYLRRKIPQINRLKITINISHHIKNSLYRQILNIQKVFIKSRLRSKRLDQLHRHL